MTRRERLYGEFIEEASRLFTDALTNQFDDPSKFVRLYALVGKLRLCTSSNVITKAEEVMQHIVKIYHLTNRDFSNPEERQRDDVDVLRAFSEACREDLGVLDSGRRGCRRRRKRLCEPLDQATHPFFADPGWLDRQVTAPCGRAPLDPVAGARQQRSAGLVSIGSPVLSRPALRKRCHDHDFQESGAVRETIAAEL
jgi:hypothetical protein